MNNASRWQLEMARKVSTVYTANAKVRAIIVAGSVACGYADAYSDVEIGVFWDDFPALAEFHAAMEQSGGDLWELDPYDAGDDVWYEEYGVAGLKIDLRHMTAARMDELLTAVIDTGDLSQRRQEIIVAVQHGVVLHGAALIESWRERAAQYPNSLARAMVGHHLSFHPWWCGPMLAERDDLPDAYGAFIEATKGIVGTLLGLNRLYNPGMKWTDHTIATLPIAPPNLADRLKQAFRADPVAGAQELQQLIEEMFRLVEREMPDVDLTELRRTFHSRRPALHAAPRGW